MILALSAAGPELPVYVLVPVALLSLVAGCAVVTATLREFGLWPRERDDEKGQ